MERVNKVVTEEFKAHGHRNILATHRTTFEITKETEVSHRGNCIIAVKSEKACLDLSDELKKALRNDKSKIKIELRCGNLVDEILASGCSKLYLTSPVSMVVRKSNFICERTLAIKADKSARDLSRELIRKLRSGEALNVKLTIFT